MTLPTKITVIGAGSASFGENTLAALIQSRKLRGSTLALVDRNPSALDIVKRLAERLNREWDSDITISAHAHHKDALDGSSFVVNAIEVGPREGLWKSDFEIPLKYPTLRSRSSMEYASLMPRTAVPVDLLTPPAMPVPSLKLCGIWRRPALTPGSSTIPTRWCAFATWSIVIAASSPSACVTN
jgi:hypothetical protein